jgi:hypothetical protein
MPAHWLGDQPVVGLLSPVFAGALGGLFATTALTKDERFNLLVAGAGISVTILLRVLLFAAGAGLAAVGVTTLVAVGLAVGTFVAVGLANIRFERSLYARIGRKRWSYHCADGSEIPVLSAWRCRSLSLAWLALAVVFAVDALWVFRSLGIGDSVSGYDVINAVLVCSACYLLGKRHWTRSVDELLQKDTRAPVVYLRSFGDDGRAMDEGFWAAVRQSVGSLASLVNLTIEQRLATHVGKVGPVVAIGRPGEDLPELGAARMYVADADWQALIRDIVVRSGMVLLQCGSTDGLKWEYSTVVSALKPDQLLLFFPYRFPYNRKTQIKRREDMFHAFQAWAAPIMPMGLPRDIGESFFLYFSNAPPWQPELLRKGAKISPEHTRRKLLRRLANETLFQPANLIGLPPFAGLTKCLMALLLLMLMPALASAGPVWGVAGIGLSISGIVAIFRYV